jgi:hypothetical protein
MRRSAALEGGMCRCRAALEGGIVPGSSPALRPAERRSAPRVARAAGPCPVMGKMPMPQVLMRRSETAATAGSAEWCALQHYSAARNTINLRASLNPEKTKAAEYLEGESQRCLPAALSGRAVGEPPLQATRASARAKKSWPSPRGEGGALPALLPAGARRVRGYLCVGGGRGRRRESLPSVLEDSTRPLIRPSATFERRRSWRWASG